MEISDVTRARLHNQLLTHQHKSGPAKIVQWLGAVQAQNYAGAKLALGQRQVNLTEAEIEKAINDGKILRTHVLRPTWHFVVPADIRWMLQLSRPRQLALNAYYYSKIGLDDKLLNRSNKIIAKALKGHNYLTRDEIVATLKESGIDIPNRLSYTFLMFHAEINALICSGPRKGKQQTYALLDERVPATAKLTDDQALAELAKRYFLSRGPATVKDFSWWSGLTLTTAKKGLEMIKESLLSEKIDNHTYWYKPSTKIPSSAGLQLLPNYDEYLVSYDDRSAAFDETKNKLPGSRTNILDYPIIVLDGSVIGVWKKTVKNQTILVETDLFIKLSPINKKELQRAVKRYGDFIGLEAKLV